MAELECLNGSSCLRCSRLALSSATTVRRIRSVDLQKQLCTSVNPPAATLDFHVGHSRPYDGFLHFDQEEKALDAQFKGRRHERWERLFSRWNHKQDKRTRHPDAWNRRTRQTVWLDNVETQKCVDSRLAVLDAQSNSCPEYPSAISSRLCDELCSLCEDGQVTRALDVLLLMDQQGIVPSVAMYKSLLKACTRRRALDAANRVQAHLAKHGLVNTGSLGEHLVSALVKCGGLGEALEVFHRLPHRTAISWTAVISGHTTSQQPEEALRMYQAMQDEGVQPNASTFVSLLIACGSIADVKRIHAAILQYKCESDSFVGNCLVNMYGKCGSMVDARNVFDRLSRQDVVSWNALLAAYAQADQGDKVLQLYGQMKEGVVSPNHRTFVILLQACGKLGEKELFVDGKSTRGKYLEMGKRLHGDAQRNDHDSDVFVGSTLISMYGKCGSVDDARNVFDGLLGRNLVSWNAMLFAYVEAGQAEKALQLYEQMWDEGISMNNRTFVSTFQACGMLAAKEQDVIVDGQYMKVKAFKQGKGVHDCARRKGCDKHLFVASALVTMYGKCGSIVDAENVFDEMTHRDLVSWNSMLTAYAEQGEAGKALELYEEMQQDGLIPDAWTYVSALQACCIFVQKQGDTIGNGYLTKMKWLERGKVIHAEAQRKYCHLNVFIGSTLVSMYGKCGSTADAWSVFTRLSELDVVSWNAMLGACLEQDQAEKALQLFEQMWDADVVPNKRTLVSALQACGMLAEKEADVWDEGSGKSKYLQKGKAMHWYAQKEGYDTDVFVGNTIVMMYGKCGSIMDARGVFDGFSERDTVSWSVMLTAYLQQGETEKALQLYGEMRNEGVSPDASTFLAVIQACGKLAGEDDVIDEGQMIKTKSLEMGKALHADALWKGYGSDVMIGSALMTLYGICGSISDARAIFDGLAEQNFISWNAMLALYVDHGQAETALQVYEQMQEKGVTPNNRTFVTALQACRLLAEKKGVFGDKMTLLEKVQAIHADAWKLGYQSDVFVGSNLISMYGKCGSIAAAWKVFDCLPEQNVVSWTAMLAAFVEQGQAEKALLLYRQMQCKGPTPDAIALVCVCQACSKTGSLASLRQIRDTHFSNASPLLANTLISAFGRCGSMVDAQSVFDALARPDVVAWSALIAGHARQGDYAASLNCYDKMKLAGVRPSGVTFLSLLAACNHTGLVEKGLQFFEAMNIGHGITPEIEHYGTLVDLLGRAGCFTMAEDLLSKMEMQPDLHIWVCLLGACQKHRNVSLGEHAFNCAVCLEPKDASAYVLMSNIYSDAGMWDKAQQVHKWRQEAGAWKAAGQSWVEHENEVHTFGAMGQNFQHLKHFHDLLQITSTLPIGA